jgi:hypothetical protein
MTVRAKALQISQLGLVPWLHVSDSDVRVMDFDACVGIFPVVGDEWIQATTFAESLAVRGYELSSIGRWQAASTFRSQVPTSLLVALRPFLLVRCRSGFRCGRSLWNDPIPMLSQYGEAR